MQTMSDGRYGILCSHLNWVTSWILTIIISNAAGFYTIYNLHDKNMNLAYILFQIFLIIFALYHRKHVHLLHKSIRDNSAGEVFPSTSVMLWTYWFCITEMIIFFAILLHKYMEF